MRKDEILRYLDGFLKAVDAPLREGVTVSRLARLLRRDLGGTLHGVPGRGHFRRLHGANRVGLCRKPAARGPPDPFGTISQRHLAPRRPRSRRQLGSVRCADRRGPAPRRPQGASRRRQCAALRPLLSQQGCRRMAGGDELSGMAVPDFRDDAGQTRSMPPSAPSRSRESPSKPTGRTASWHFRPSLPACRARRSRAATARRSMAVPPARRR